jgi:hypothetical protein
MIALRPPELLTLETILSEGILVRFTLLDKKFAERSERNKSYKSPLYRKDLWRCNKQKVTPNNEENKRISATNYNDYSVAELLQG